MSRTWGTRMEYTTQWYSLLVSPRLGLKTQLCDSDGNQRRHIASSRKVR
jgi:hypothetical protein